jgi:diketogulonate reductase-like aldo/keto reductase
VEAVQEALAAGYELIDTSLAYWNEREVAEGLRRSGLPREQVFLTSKLENDDHGYESTLAACRETLDNLGTDYLDLYLIHWPVPGRRDDTWRAMERLYREGLCRAVGVSNYTVRHLEQLLAWAEVVPAVNQVECHPFLQQRDLLDFCLERGIALQAYSPLVKATRMQHPVLQELAGRLGRTPAQVLLRWQVEREVSAIPKSVQPGHIRENLQVFDFALDPQDRQALNALDQGLHVDWDPTDLA